MKWLQPLVFPFYIHHAFICHITIILILFALHLSRVVWLNTNENTFIWRITYFNVPTNDIASIDHTCTCKYWSVNVWNAWKHQQKGHVKANITYRSANSLQQCTSVMLCHFLSMPVKPATMRNILLPATCDPPATKWLQIAACLVSSCWA